MQLGRFPWVGAFHEQEASLLPAVSKGQQGCMQAGQSACVTCLCMAMWQGVGWQGLVARDSR